MKNLLKKMPIFLLMMIGLILLTFPWMPLPLKQALYAFSLNIKSFIIVMLPFIIFGLLFRASVLMAEKATWMIALIIGMVTASTFSAVFVARFVGQWLYGMDISMGLPPALTPLQPLWTLDIGPWIQNEWVMGLAVTLGIGGALWAPSQAEKIAGHLDRIVGMILKIISLLIPFFVAGFVTKLQQEGAFAIIAQKYALVFTIIVVSKFAYLFFLYWATSGFRLKATLHSLKAFLPAGISGFSTMSSAASLPLIVQGVQSTTRHKHLAQIGVPLLVNIHMIGECFADVILAYAVLKTYGMPEPSLGQYAVFSLYFMAKRFSVAGVPGGGILVIYDLFVTYFLFNQDMLSLITALYILFDPFATAGNILGDGVLSQMIDKIVNRWPFLAYSKKDILQKVHLKHQESSID